MEYNKFTHSDRKQWLVVSVSVLAALSGGLLMTHNNSNVHASAVNSNQNLTSQQTQTNHTYQPQLHVNQPAVNNQDVQTNAQQNVKPQINNLCGQILKNHVQSSENIDNGSRRTLGAFSVPSEINSQANYRNIKDGTIVEYDSMDGAEGSKIDYSQYTNPKAIPIGFTFVKLGKHSNVYLPQNEPGGINTIWIAPISKAKSQSSSTSSSVTSASSSAVNSSASASSSESLSSNVIPPKSMSNSVSSGSVHSGSQSSNSSSASTNASVSSFASSSSAAPSNSVAPSSVSSSTSIASASKSTSVSSSASESQLVSSVSASNQASHSASQNSVNNKSVRSNSTTSNWTSSGTSNNNVSASTTSISSSTSSSNVTPASKTSEASSNSVSSTTSIQSSSTSVVPSFVPSFMSSSVSSSSVDINSNLNSWYASFVDSIASNHQSATSSSIMPTSNTSNSTSSSVNSIINFSSLNNNDQQSQMNSTASVRHTKSVAHHVRASRKSKNRMKTWRYRGHTYHTYRQYITPNDFRKGHHMYIRLIKDCNEYRSTHYTRRTRIRHLHKGMWLSVRRVVMITPHITRFQLTNGDYVTSNQYFARIIK